MSSSLRSGEDIGTLICDPSVFMHAIVSHQRPNNCLRNDSTRNSYEYRALGEPGVFPELDSD